MVIVTAVATVLSMLTFIGICWWAWSARRKSANEESAMLPFSLPDESTYPSRNQ